MQKQRKKQWDFSLSTLGNTTLTKIIENKITNSFDSFTFVSFQHKLQYIRTYKLLVYKNHMQINKLKQQATHCQINSSTPFVFDLLLFHILSSFFFFFVFLSKKKRTNEKTKLPSKRFNKLTPTPTTLT